MRNVGTVWVRGEAQGESENSQIIIRVSRRVAGGREAREMEGV